MIEATWEFIHALIVSDLVMKTLIIGASACLVFSVFTAIAEFAERAGGAHIAMGAPVPGSEVGPSPDDWIALDHAKICEFMCDGSTRLHAAVELTRPDEQLALLERKWDALQWLWVSERAMQNRLAMLRQFGLLK